MYTEEVFHALKAGLWSYIFISTGVFVFIALFVQSCLSMIKSSRAIFAIEAIISVIAIIYLSNFLGLI